MATIVAKSLLHHIEFEVYDSEGFVDYNRLKEILGIKAKNIAHAVGRTSRALEKNPRSESIQKGLRKIVYVFMLLKEMLESEEQIFRWLRAPNPDYDGLSPLEVISIGKVDSILNYLEEIKKGALS